MYLASIRMYSIKHISCFVIGLGSSTFLRNNISPDLHSYINTPPKTKDRNVIKINILTAIAGADSGLVKLVNMTNFFFND